MSKLSYKICDMYLHKFPVLSQNPVVLVLSRIVLVDTFKPEELVRVCAFSTWE